MTVQPIRDQLRALADAATPGPWEASWTMDDDGELTVSAGTALPNEDGLLPGSYVSTDVILEWDDAWPEDGGEQRHADAEFIAAARTAVPALLDMLAAAEHRATRAEAHNADEIRAIAEMTVYSEQALQEAAELMHSVKLAQAEARIKAWKYPNCGCDQVE